jgi:protein gp37
LSFPRIDDAAGGAADSGGKYEASAALLNETDEGKEGSVAGKSNIEWTEATWNPIVGCSIVSPGCTNCYAMKMAARIERMGSGPHYAGTTKVVNGKAVWTGKLARAEGHVWSAPLLKRKPTVYFVNSMGDLFHEDCPNDWVLDALTVMAAASNHTFQVLTKRAARMREFMSRPGLLEDIYVNWYGYCSAPAEVESWPLPNVWLGVSCERQQEADERIPDLLATPAAVRFVSAEPLLGPIDFRFDHGVCNKCGYCGPCTRTRLGLAHPHCNYTAVGGRNLDWVIVGGESGPGARPMHPDWARSLRAQCTAAGVPFFFKQHGQHIGHSCVTWDRQGAHTSQTFGKPSFEAYGELFWTVGKKAAGRLLDGREWNEMPTITAREKAA